MFPAGEWLMHASILPQIMVIATAWRAFLHSTGSPPLSF
jgi:hypothetical protein